MIIPTPNLARLLAGLALLLALLPACARMGAGLPQARDLQATGHEAARAGVPVVLAVVADGCPYCRVVEDEVLRPMQADPAYRQGVRLRLLNLSDPRPLRDFDGRMRTPAEIAARYRAHVTPTLLILGPGGQEIGERQVGITVIDFYWSYLDAALEEARQHLAKSGSPDS